MKQVLYGLACILVLSIASSCSSDSTPGEYAAGKTSARVKTLCSALEVYREDEGALPDAALGLNVFLTDPKREGAKTAFDDGWRRPVRPIVSGSKIVGIYSLGADGVDDSGRNDDVACRVAVRD